ncbi:carbamoyltransferase family protein [Pedobacter polysacchareus]|uniref:carbamoyltransferase family protein n=1 Tax=Pedobacter polysacchareus TaxID=2861973 RepID=UPI001C9948C3|nr:carbamoyltransferase C-terminal domain-containing protein [Pedobacter polysacchareus]
MDKYFIGLSTSGHDPAFSVVNDKGEVIFAEATERFVQQKRAWGIDADHPEHIRSVLPDLISPAAEIVISKSWIKSKKGLPIDIAGGLLVDSTTAKWLVSLQDKVFANAGENLREYLLLEEDNSVECFDHHLCHAVNACYTADFSSGLCLVIDGEGEVGAVSVYRLKDRTLQRIWRSWGPGSLGSYYGWLTKICGFDTRRGEEWKVMGLAAFGKPVEFIVEALKKLIEVKEGRLLFASEAQMQEVINHIKPFYRKPEEELMMVADLAASGQAAYAYFADQILIHCESYGEENLILSGGCALNSSYNGSIIGRFSFLNVHVPAAPADDGNALGAAILSWMKAHQTVKIPYGKGSAYLGKQVKTEAKIFNSLSKYGASLRVMDLKEDSGKIIAKKLFEGKIIGVMHGGAEFGPRALGNRSILADPRGDKTKDYINNEIKGRESYRPFAPIVFEHDVENYFEKAHRSPYMSFTLPWKAEMKKIVPAVVHEDGTGRLQTINQKDNPWMTEVLTEFGALSGVPVLLNTSFNVMGKPIVNSIDDALVVLLTSGLDAILYDTILVEK